MKLSEIATTHSVARKDTCKLFWGLYPYSLTAQIPVEMTERHKQAVDVFWKKVKAGQVWKKVVPNIKQSHVIYNRELNSWVAGILYRNEKTLDKDDFYYLASGNRTSNNITFYVKSADIAAELISQNPELFFKYSAPRNIDVENRLHDNKKIEIREKLWYGQYDYKIEFKYQSINTIATLDERVKNLYFSNSLYNFGQSRVLYVASEDDYFLAYLALSDQIAKTTRCELIIQNK